LRRDSRHQHISSLIRKKTEYIFYQYHESKIDLSEEEIENIMTQIVLFYDRNKTIEDAVYSSLIGGIIFAIDIVIFHEFAANASPESQWMIVFVIPGLVFLALSLCLAIKEFKQSSLTLDLEIILAGSKTKTKTQPQPQHSSLSPSQTQSHIRIYKDWKNTRKDLIEKAKNKERK
jgi:hypothetical protein